MRKHLIVAALGAAVSLSIPTQSMAGINLTAGSWELEFSGNVNGFITSTDCDSNGNGVISGGLACGSNGVDRDLGNVRTGLLPSWFGFSAKTNANGLDTGITIGFQPGVDSNTGITGTSLDGGLGLNSANFRQVFLEFGKKDGWGSLKIGRDIGVFGSDAILNDMTLLGVGTISDLTGNGGNTSLGRIGVGYLYADWKGQIQYTSPKISFGSGGLSFTGAIVDPWGMTNLTGLSHNAASAGQEGDTFGLEGKANLDWGGPVPGKAWVGFINQDVDSAAFNDTATGFDIGGKITVGGVIDLVGYYYSGEGIGTTDFLFDGFALNGNPRDSDGFYVQGVFTIPGPGTKLGLSYGESSLDLANGEAVSTLVETNKSVVVGAYHPMTANLNLVLEYTQTEAEAHNGNDAEESSIAAGAIFFF